MFYTGGCRSSGRGLAAFEGRRGETAQEARFFKEPRRPGTRQGRKVAPRTGLRPPGQTLSHRNVGHELSQVRAQLILEHTPRPHIAPAPPRAWRLAPPRNHRAGGRGGALQRHALRPPSEVPKAAVQPAPPPTPAPAPAPLPAP